MPPDRGDRESETVAVASVDRNPADTHAITLTSNAVAQFAIDLNRVLGAETDNVAFSPYSAAIALSMVRAGAAGETAAQIDAVLHAGVAGDLAAGFNALDQALMDRAGLKERGDGSTATLTLEAANALWGQRGFRFLDPYLRTLAANYGSGVRLVDFTDDAEGARRRINRWVAGRTGDRIPTLIPPGVFNELTRLVLTNAIYLKAPWADPFLDGGTSDGPFHLLNGDIVDVPLMVLKDELAYAAGAVELSGRHLGRSRARYQVVRLPYVGREFAMLVIVPDTGVFESVEAGLDSAFLENATDRLTTGKVHLRFPRFKIRTKSLLADALGKLGMSIAFTPDADFSGLTSNAELQLEEVVHESFITADEEGTEAAAATAMIPRPTAVPSSRTIELIVDRPFLFAIRDEPTGAILFLGRVVNPAAK